MTEKADISHGRLSGICGGKCRETMGEGVVKTNPIVHQVLGICSALAITNRMENALVMGIAVIIVMAMSNLSVSLLRGIMPRRIRMIVEVALIATFVIIIDQFLKAFYWEMSKQLGPYVALIITNCIIMGRAEAFAIQNPPLLSVVDGVANGIGYAVVLLLIAFIRELLGSGSLFGYVILDPSWYVQNIMFILAPGAFFAAGFLIWIINALNPYENEEEE